MVVSENLAREYWKNPADAVGKRITQSQENPWREIIGVVGNERDDGLDRPATAIVYWPMLIKEWWTEPIDVESHHRPMSSDRTRVGSPGFLRELQQAVWSVNPNLPLASVRTLDEIQADSIAQTSFALVMLAIAATVALLLGSVGIYGVIALCCGAADARDRDPHGARRADRRCAPAVSPSRALVNRRRHCTGHRCCAGDHARHVRIAVRRQPDGSRHVRRGRGEPGAASPCWRRIFLPAALRVSIPSSPCERMSDTTAFT